MKKKFISFIYGYHPTLYLLDKESNYHIGPCLAMSALGYEVEMVVLGKSCRVEDDPNYDARISVKYFTNALSALWYIYKHRDAIVYANTFTIPSLLIGLLGRKTIFFSHTVIFPIKDNSYSFIKNLFVKVCYHFFTLIRATNAYEKQLLQEKNIHHGISLPLVVNTHIKKSLNNNNNILLLGHIMEIKQPIIILKALQNVLQKYPHIKIYQVGSFSDFLYKGKTYKEYINIFGLQDNIVLLGKLKKKDISPNINTSIYINSSLMEGQCLAVYDAAMMGNALCLPNISSFMGVLDGNVKYHNTGDYKTLAENIIRYIENPKEKERMIKENQQHIAKYYNYDYIQKKIQIAFSALDTK